MLPASKLQERPHVSKQWMRGETFATARVPAVTSYVIHIGPHKTGTTYLQHAFTELRPWLAQRGVCYPDTWGTIHGHHLLTERLARDTGGSLQTEFDKLAGNQDFDTVLLSSETLAYGTDMQVHRLKELLRDAPVAIVFYVRRWSELIPSHWREVVKHGSLETLPEFALARLADPAASEIVNFALVLGRYAKVFGADSLRVASYSAVVESGEDLLRHFCRSFLAWEAPPPIKPRRLNESLSMVDSELVRILNALEWTRARERRTKPFQRYIAAKNTLPVQWIIDQSMQFTVNRVHIDDGASGLAQLHDRIANQYRYALVAPCPGGRLFEPRAVDVNYIQTAYLLQPGIMEALRNMQAKLLTAEGIT
jgi:hypothetical protein